MAANYLNTDNKLNYLYKKSQGVAQTQIDTDDTNELIFTLEGKKALSNIFQKDVFAEDIPITLVQTLRQMFFDTTIPDSSWNTTTSDQTLSYIDLSSGTGINYPLRFYKSVYLEPTSSTSQSWWLLDPSGDGTTSSDNNLLKDMIPFKYNDLNTDTYTPIVTTFDSTTNNWITRPQGIIADGNWAIDYATGILQFHSNQTSGTNTLASINVGPLPTSAPDKRPRISFIKYIGGKGTSSGGSGGTAGKFKVGDFSGVSINVNDVSAVLFNKDHFDVSYVAGAAQINSLSDAGIGGLADISYYFFDKPNAPFDGSWNLNTSVSPAVIDCSWQNPPNVKSALPFGLSEQYLENFSTTSQEPIGHLPFFKELCIQYKETFPVPTGGWIDLSLVNATGGKTIIPDTVTRLTAGAGGTTTDMCGNGTSTGPGGSETAPFYKVITNTLTIGKGYQFRIFLKNDSIESGLIDPLYNIPATYNYLYIPNISGGHIELGNFGPIPNNFIGTLAFQNTSFLRFDITGSNTDSRGADVSLNTQFSINPVLSLRVFYGVDVSCARDISSIQAPAYYAPVTPDYQFEHPSSSGTTENNFLLDGDWDSPGGLLVNDLSWAPQHTYTINRFYSRNTAFPTILGDVSGLVPLSFTTDIPSRSELSIQQNLFQDFTTTKTLVDADINTTGTVWTLGTTYNAYPPAPNNTLITKIFFLNNTDSLRFNLDESRYMVTDQPDKNGKFLGTTSNGKELFYMKMDANTGSVFTLPTSYVYDVSTNVSIGSGALGALGASAAVYNTSATDPSAIFMIRCDVDDVMNLPGAPAGVDLYQAAGYYLDVIQGHGSQQLTNVKLDSFPDISNNFYNPYNVIIKQFYNDNTAGVTWINPPGTTGQKYNFHIAKQPTTDIQFLETSYTNPDISMNNTLMGIDRPNINSLVTSIIYTYDLSDIWPDWRTNTTISTNVLVYSPNTSPTYTQPTYGQNTHNWTTLTTTQSITTNLRIDPRDLMAPNGSANRRYSRDVPGQQFEIRTFYENNITRTPNSNPTVLKLLQFGTPGADLWWDYTWEGTTSVNGTASTATNMPSGFFNFVTATGSATARLLISGVNITPPPPPPSSTAASDFDHASTVSTNTQLIWANGAFRGPDTPTTSDNNPYIDYSSYYNLSVDYTSLHGVGKSADPPSFTAGQWWYDNTTSNTSNTVVIHDVKFITVKIQATSAPSSAWSNFELDVRDANNIRLKPWINTSNPGFILYVSMYDTANTTQNAYPNGAGRPSTAIAYYGLLTFSSAAGLNSIGCFDASVKPLTGNYTGYGKWILPYNINNTTTSFYLSIGVPDNLSIKNITMTLG